MAEFLRITEVKKTRKIHRCSACGEVIEKGAPAYAWTSVDGTIFTTHLHNECGEDVQKHCFKCNKCADDDGYQESFMWHAMTCGVNCDPCNRIRNLESEAE
jgi:hypothetical protein